MARFIIGYELAHINLIICCILFSINIISIVDRNECLRNMTGCHMNASCVNIEGSHNCECNKGFSGNGTHCTGMLCSNIVQFSMACQVLKKQ